MKSTGRSAAVRVIDIRPGNAYTDYPIERTPDPKTVRLCIGMKTHTKGSKTVSAFWFIDGFVCEVVYFLWENLNLKLLK